MHLAVLLAKAHGTASLPAFFPSQQHLAEAFLLDHHGAVDSETRMCHLDRQLSVAQVEAHVDHQYHSVALWRVDVIQS